MAVPKEAADGKICEASAHAYMSVREASTGVKIPEKHALKNKTIVNVPSKDTVLKEPVCVVLQERGNLRKKLEQERDEPQTVATAPGTPRMRLRPPAQLTLCWTPFWMIHRLETVVGGRMARPCGESLPRGRRWWRGA